MFDKKLLNGKNIVITGGGTGLGKSMAARFVELGANIAITSRKNEVINSAAKELKKGRAKVIAIQCDVRDPEQVEMMIGFLTSDGRLGVVYVRTTWALCH